MTGSLVTGTNVVSEAVVVGGASVETVVVESATVVEVVSSLVEVVASGLRRHDPVRVVPVRDHGNGAREHGEHGDEAGDDRGAAPHAELRPARGRVLQDLVSLSGELFGKLCAHCAPSMSSMKSGPSALRSAPIPRWR